MTDRNGAPVTVGARVRFRTTLDGGLWRRDDDPWRTGTVRAVREWSYYRLYNRPAATVWEALVDDGDPAEADLTRNGFHVAAWAASDDITVLETP